MTRQSGSVYRMSPRTDCAVTICDIDHDAAADTAEHSWLSPASEQKLYCFHFLASSGIDFAASVATAEVASQETLLAEKKRFRDELFGVVEWHVKLDAVSKSGNDFPRCLSHLFTRPSHAPLFQTDPSTSVRASVVWLTFLFWCEFHHHWRICLRHNSAASRSACTRALFAADLPLS